MGQKKSREERVAAKVQELRSYLSNYQYSLRALMKAMPGHVLRERPPFASVGRVEIWPCRDAAVVLVYPSDSEGIEIIVKPSTSKDHSEFLGSSAVGTYYEADGTPASWRPVVSIHDASNYIVYGADPISIGTLGAFRPKFAKVFVFGWDAPLPQPDDEALISIRADLAVQNLTHGDESPQGNARARAAALISEYREVLATASREEEAQRFLRLHPELLYPDYLECHAKLRLGEDYVTDFVVVAQGISGQEYVFVEIERPDKPIFVSKGHFSQEFTQAKDQLLRWITWVGKNRLYLERKLPNMTHPIFHLVIGRSSELGGEQRDRLRAEFSPTERRFSTYDDLVDRFEKIIDNLFGFG